MSMNEYNLLTHSFRTVATPSLNLECYCSVEATGVLIAN